MKKYITYTPEAGFSITTYRLPAGYSCNNFLDFIEDVSEGRSSTYEGCFDRARVEINHGLIMLGYDDSRLLAILELLGRD